MAGQRNDYGKRSHSQPEYSGDGGIKRRNPGEERDQHSIGSEDTVYRYLCPVRKIGSIIGKGGDIAKQLRSESKSNIRIAETMLGCDERVVTIWSSSEETNSLGDEGEFVSAAQDALFMVYDRIIADELPADEEFDEAQKVTVRMLVPSDQIGCLIGKGGQVIQNLRSETGAQIRILNDEHLPTCALNSDELLQIIGEPTVVRKALFQVASRLHDNPSRSQHRLLSHSSNTYQSGSLFISPHAGAPIMGSYGGYRDETSAMEFSLHMLCPTGNIGGVIGKGGAIIKQIRQESGASIKVDSSGDEGDDCVIFISAREFFEDPSPTINAALQLQPRCSEKAERESGDSFVTTRLLVPSSRIGCLIGKGGSIITEMRNMTRASIRIISKENLPKVAAEDEEMVQITGSLDVASNALLQVTSRLRGNIFDREGALASFPSAVPYIPMSVDMSVGVKYGTRDSQQRGHGYSSYSGDLPQGDGYGSYGSAGRGGYEGYSGYSSGRSGSGRLSGRNPISHGKHHGY